MQPQPLINTYSKTCMIRNLLEPAESECVPKLRRQHFSVCIDSPYSLLEKFIWESTESKNCTSKEGAVTHTCLQWGVTFLFGICFFCFLGSKRDRLHKYHHVWELLCTDRSGSSLFVFILQKAKEILFRRVFWLNRFHSAHSAKISIPTALSLSSQWSISIYPATALIPHQSTERKLLSDFHSDAGKVCIILWGKYPKWSTGAPKIIVIETILNVSCRE
jgi:hypothetical protein